MNAAGVGAEPGVGAGIAGCDRTVGCMLLTIRGRRERSRERRRDRSQTLASNVASDVEITPGARVAVPNAKVGTAAMFSENLARFIVEMLLLATTTSVRPRGRSQKLHRHVHVAGAALAEIRMAEVPRVYVLVPLSYVLVGDPAPPPPPPPPPADEEEGTSSFFSQISPLTLWTIATEVIDVEMEMKMLAQMGFPTGFDTTQATSL